MATPFPRTILPASVTRPAFPPGLWSRTGSGRPQARAIQQLGRQWTETFAPMQAGTASVEAFLATVQRLQRDCVTVDVAHQALTAMLGTGAGTPLVNGGGQTGAYIQTDGWTPSSAVLKAGDVIRFAGLTLVYDVVEDVTADGSGNAVVHVHPPIYATTDLIDNAQITVNVPAGSVTFRCLVSGLTVPEAPPDHYYGGLQITFTEVVAPIAAATGYDPGDSLATATFSRASTATYTAGP